MRPRSRLALRPARRTGPRLTASLRELVCRTGRTDDLREVHLHLQISVPVVVNSGSPLFSFALFEDGLRHLEFPQLSGQGQQPRGSGPHLRGIVHVVAQGNERVD